MSPDRRSEDPRFKPTSRQKLFSYLSNSFGAQIRVPNLGFSPKSSGTVVAAPPAKYLISGSSLTCGIWQISQGCLEDQVQETSQHVAFQTTQWSSMVEEVPSEEEEKENMENGSKLLPFSFWVAAYEI